MFTIDHLSKTYQSTGKSAVKDLSLTVGSGEIYGFLGANGAGKSTTIQCVSGILIQDEGTITLNGVDNRKNPIEFKNQIGYVPDLNNAFERISGREYIKRTALLYGMRTEAVGQKIDFWAEKFHLGDAVERPIKTYSHGMKQKLTMIAAIIHEPKLWLLDEPMTGLDPKTTLEVVGFMREYASAGNAVLFSSHVLEAVEKICDKVGILKDGVMKGEFYISSMHFQGETLPQIYEKLNQD